MRILLAMTVFAFACGGPKPKGESAIVNESGDQSPTCCCKVMPKTAEKEIVPSYTMMGRMECSTTPGDCVDEVQCNASEEAGQDMSTPSPDESGAAADGVPPPPTLEPDTATP